MTDNRFEKQKATTRDKIQTAFIELINTKDFDSITVREIAEQAGIGFKTYYRHYDDKNALVHAIIEVFWAEFSQELEPALTMEATRRNARRLLNYVHENAEMVLAITRTPEKSDIISTVFTKGIADGLKLQVTALDDETQQNAQIRQMVAVHFVNAQFGLIQWWLENDLEISIDDMEHLVHELIIEPIWNLSRTPSTQ